MPIHPEEKINVPVRDERIILKTGIDTDDDIIIPANDQDISKL